MNPAPARDPAQIFESHLQLVHSVVERVCRAHRLSGQDAEEFASTVNFKLIDNNYRIFRNFRGDADLQTFLFVVVERLLIDFRRQQWGKWHPSARARRLGSVAILLELLMVRDELSFDQACETLRTNHQVTETERELAEILRQLPLRTKRRVVADEAIPEHLIQTPPDAERYEARAEEERIVALLEQAMARLSPRDRFLIKLRFFDGLTVPQIARGHGFDQKTLYREIERLRRELRSDLEAQGVSREDVSDWLGEVELDFPPPAEPEGGKGSPSR